ncbi:hypothetical protein M434DRAFT_66929 [Hypoxylon sp. CO27-5]|nr:hypothetical protein M434DRAFT_66929 [Hypoxylon sp. CO27-5]
MAPLTPHWDQPSHPDIQDVIINEHEFTSKSLSKISLPPFGLYAKMEFPPCTFASAPTYATVQCGRDKHLNLNSDLLYINHSCEPSLIFDTANMNIIAGPNGLRAGEELTVRHLTPIPMAQPFDCLCGKPTCRGRIGGAKDMTKAELEGVWLNGHILELLKEQDNTTLSEDATAHALKDALKHAEMVVEAARVALESYLESTALMARHDGVNRTDNGAFTGEANANSFGGADATLAAGLKRRGVTSRELSGEMGGDTIVASVS